jgi:hypothetical protein
MLPGRYRLMLIVAIVVIVVLLLALLVACNLGQRASYSETKVPVSQEAADRLGQRLKETATREGDGAFSLEATDVELTSYLALRMADEIDGLEDVPLEDLQVQFTGGQMLFSGKLRTVCPFSLNLKVVASAQVDGGQLDLRLERAQAGAIPIPKGLLKSLSRIINETIAEAPERLERAVEITDVQIGEGTIFVSGRVVEGE